MSTKVFVYGTLRKGLAWHHLLKEAGFVGEAATKEKYALYANGIPYVIQNEEISLITGEVYNVDNNILQDLDQLEGHPNWYCRKEIYVILKETQEEITAWIYFFPKPTGKLIPSGDFKDYSKSRQ